MQLCIDVSASIPFCKRVLRALYALVSSKRSAPPSVSRARNLGSECVLFRNVDGDYGAGLPLPGALGAWGVFSEAQRSVCRKNTHDRAYLSIGVTCGIGARLCRVPGGVFSVVPGGGYAGSCKRTSENSYSTHSGE